MRSAEQRDIDWQGLIDKALTAPGQMGNTYSRFYEYSFTNQMFLLWQGIEPQPVATYKRWQEIGRQVVKGAKAREIIRPVIVPKEDEATGQKVQKLVGFKPVRCIFPLEDTTGPELPPIEAPGWDLATAEERLAIKRVKYQLLDGNTQGYSIGREYAINPVAVAPLKTTMHEIGHIVIGHTTEAGLQEYSQHRGVMEFQAESTAYLSMNELGTLDEAQASESRAYIQNWLHGTGERPDDLAIRAVFSATDAILKAGRQQAMLTEGAA